MNRRVHDAAPRQQRSRRKFPPPTGRRGKPDRFRTISAPLFISCLVQFPFYRPEPARPRRRPGFNGRWKPPASPTFGLFFQRAKTASRRRLILLPVPVPQKPVRKAILNVYQKLKLQFMRPRPHWQRQFLEGASASEIQSFYAGLESPERAVQQRAIQKVFDIVSRGAR